MIDSSARQKIREWLAARAREAERYRREHALEEIYIPRQPKTEITGDRVQLYDAVAATLGDVPLQYLEFGVFRGRSIAEITKRFRHPEARFFGFDSFEGLPEAWGHAAPKTFTTGGAIPAAADPLSLGGAGRHRRADRHRDRWPAVDAWPELPFAGALLCPVHQPCAGTSPARHHRRGDRDRRVFRAEGWRGCAGIMSCPSGQS